MSIMDPIRLGPAELRPVEAQCTGGHMTVAVEADGDGRAIWHQDGSRASLEVPLVVWEQMQAAAGNGQHQTPADDPRREYGLLASQVHGLEARCAVLAHANEQHLETLHREQDKTDALKQVWAAAVALAWRLNTNQPPDETAHAARVLTETLINARDHVPEDWARLSRDDGLGGSRLG